MSRRGARIFSFALYDWGNSAFTTLVVTFIYSAYFTRAITPDEITGTALWSRGITVSALLVALLAPVLGAIADRRGIRRFFLLGATLACVMLTGALSFFEPGQVMGALTVFVAANIAFELGMVFYNSYLPDIAGPDDMGRVSGMAWAMGYAGGLACLVLALFGFVRTGSPLFGISTEAGLNIRATNLLAASWYLVFSIPFLMLAADTEPVPGRARGSLGGGLRSFGRTLRSLAGFGDLWRFLLARLLYNDGLITVFAFGGIYAAGTFGMDFSRIIIFGIVLNLAAGLGAFLFGFVDDLIGARRTVLLSLAALAAASLLAALTRSEALFWLAGVVIGIFAGPNQAASRSLMGRFTPRDKEAEFFGFFAFSGKLTAFMGPFLLGVVTQLTGSQRWGVSTVLLFFIAGGALLLTVDEERGKRKAREYEHIGSPGG